MLEMTLATGLACFGLVVLVRAMPSMAARLEQGAKPWACNLCMSSYAAFLAAMPRIIDLCRWGRTEGADQVKAAWGWYEAAVFAGGCLAVCYLLLTLAESLRPPPPMFPPLPEPGDGE